MKRQLLLIALATFISILASACSTVSVPMKVTHPAKVNLSGYERVMISKMNGDSGPAMEAKVRNLIASSSKLTIVGKRALGKYKVRYRETNANLKEAKLKKSKNKRLANVIHIMGSFPGSYQHGVVSEKDTCKTKKRGKYSCIRYKRVGTYTLRGEIKIADMETGIIFYKRPFKIEESDYKLSVDTSPGNIDKATLKRKARQKATLAIKKILLPWTETIYVPFEKDKAIPGMEGGIIAAQGGRLDDAVRIFSEQIVQAQQDGVESKIVALAYWNLALALEHSGQYDDAINALQKAYSLRQRISFLDEQDKVKKLRQEEQELKRQGVM